MACHCSDSLSSRLHKLSLNQNESHDELIHCLNDVTACISSEASRNAVDNGILRSLEAVIFNERDSCQFPVTVWVEIFRLLRNYAAISKTHQDDIVRTELLFDCAVLRIKKTISSITFDDVSTATELRCSVQFLGNLVTNNVNNKHLIWHKIMPLFRSLLSNADTILIKYSTMLLYNCIVECCDLRDSLLQCEDGLFIVGMLLQSVVQSESEWGLCAVEYFLGSELFVTNYYPLLSCDQRISVIDIMISMLNNPRLSEGCIPFESLKCVAEGFEQKADNLLKMKQSTDQQNVLEVVRFVEVLCCASSVALYQSAIGKLSCLLCTAVFLLRSIHEAGKQSANSFTPIGKLTSVANPDSDIKNHPAYGLKCNLIRLIANMCWQNKENQDKVREFDGIPLLLDCCKLDAKNPFITQWVVFAIRNLCQDNLENQELIASMERMNLVESAILKEMNVVVTEKDDGHFSVSLSPDVKLAGVVSDDGKSKMERAVDDIRDLFS